MAKPKPLDPQARLAIGEISAAFLANLPERGRPSGGVFTFPDSHPLREQVRDIPDGSYRVFGRDWILRFEGGRIVDASLAGPRSNPDSYTEIVVNG